ncbi:MAG: hypothetical protein ACR2H2_02840 [Solirubrobacteraceae bacterium]
MTAHVDHISKPFDAALWAAAEEGRAPDSLRDLVHGPLHGERGDQLTVSTIIADGCEPAERLAQAAAGTVSAFIWAGPIGVLRVGEGEDAYTVSVWPTTQEGVHHLIGTVPVTDERWRRVERWLANSAPRLVPFVLNQADFEGIGAALAEHGRVEVSRLTARVLRDGSSYTRGWAEGRRSPRPTYSQALAEVEDFASVRTLTVHVGDLLSLHLRRQAGATFYGGSFRLFEDVVLAALVGSAARRRALLSGRERHAHVRTERAIAVQMPSGIFSEGESVSELLEALAEQRGVGIAVLHRNPYLHVAVTDYLDGSNFDAFVTSDDSVVIYPGYRASAGALTRLTEHIAERFAAREVADVPASKPPTRDELFTTG